MTACACAAKARGARQIVIKINAFTGVSILDMINFLFDIWAPKNRGALEIKLLSGRQEKSQTALFPRQPGLILETRDISAPPNGWFGFANFLKEYCLNPSKS